MPSARAILFQALIVASSLLFLEGLARIAYTVQANPKKESDWFAYSADLGWDRRPDFDGLDDCRARRTFDDQGFVSVDGGRLKRRAAAGQFRALFLGDSNTYGFCLNTDQTFVEVANRLLPDSISVNLGVNGHTSYQGYKSLLKYGDVLKPNIVFVSYNFNDRRHVLQEEQVDGDGTFQRLYSGRLVRRLSEYSYLFRVADFVGRRLSIGSLGITGSIGQVSLDKVRPRVDAQQYRQNLTKMVHWARQRGVAIVFILLADNPNENFSLREGIRYLSEKKYELAIKYLTFAKERPNSWFSALAGLYLSKVYSELGSKDKAQQALSHKNALISVHGGYPIALDSEYHKVMREVADEFGVQVVDAARELSRTPAVYFDSCHFDGSGHEIVGHLVKDVIETAKIGLVASKR